MQHLDLRRVSSFVASAPLQLRSRSHLQPAGQISIIFPGRLVRWVGLRTNSGDFGAPVQNLGLRTSDTLIAFSTLGYSSGSGEMILFPRLDPLLGLTHFLNERLLDNILIVTVKVDLKRTLLRVFLHADHDDLIFTVMQLFVGFLFGIVIVFINVILLHVSVIVEGVRHKQICSGRLLRLRDNRSPALKLDGHSVRFDC
jgi:hypothetical protein